MRNILFTELNDVRELDLVRVKKLHSMTGNQGLLQRRSSTKVLESEKASEIKTKQKTKHFNVKNFLPSFWSIYQLFSSCCWIFIFIMYNRHTWYKDKRTLHSLWRTGTAGQTVHQQTEYCNSYSAQQQGQCLHPWDGLIQGHSTLQLGRKHPIFRVGAGRLKINKRRSKYHEIQILFAIIYITISAWAWKTMKTIK